MRKILKIIGTYVITYMILIVIFIAGLSFVSLIPRERIRENVKKSLEQFEKENLAQEVGIIKKTILDDYTDALMMNISYSIDTSEPIQSAMADNFKYRIESGTVVGPVVNLRESIENDNIKYYGYSRYWHGYLIYLRPLLVIFDYNFLRAIFTIILDLLAIRLIYLLYKKQGKAIALILFISLFIVSYHYCGLSLTYFPVLCISMVTSIYIVKKEKLNYITFFIVGALTSFFDLLTTPLLTFGIPLLIYLIIKGKELTFKEMLILAINWGLGYGVIWVSKWILASIILNKDIIADATKAITKRSGAYANGEKVTLLKTFIRNIMGIQYEISFIILLTITSLIIRRVENLEISKKEVLQYLMIAFLPILWYGLTKNHSCIHPKFTYRNMFLTIFSLLVLDYKILKISQNKKVLKGKKL